MVICYPDITHLHMYLSFLLEFAPLGYWELRTKNNNVMRRIPLEEKLYFKVQAHMVLTFIKMAGGHEEKVDFKFISGIGGTS